MLAVGHLLTTSAAPLTEALVPSGPGVYALSYTGSVVDSLRNFSANRSILYIGTGMLRERRRAHVQSLQEAKDLNVDEFELRVIPYATHCEADLAEQLLIDALRPAWNQEHFKGFGSGVQGAARRASQRPSAWDVMFPGRRHRAQPTAADSMRRAALLDLLSAYPALNWTGD